MPYRRLGRYVVPDDRYRQRSRVKPDDPVICSLLALHWGWRPVSIRLRFATFRQAAERITAAVRRHPGRLFWSYTEKDNRR
jgi:hypothetical protein